MPREECFPQRVETQRGLMPRDNCCPERVETQSGLLSGKG